MPYRLIYRSHVANRVRFEDAEAIAEHSAVKNAKLGVTGLLVYTPSHFLQVLEGEKERIESLFERLKSDPRHQRVQRLCLDPISERAFEKWAMRATMPIGELSSNAMESLDAQGALELLLNVRSN